MATLQTGDEEEEEGGGNKHSLFVRGGEPEPSKSTSKERTRLSALAPTESKSLPSDEIRRFLQRRIEEVELEEKAV